jgi:hypothetical protein
MPRLSSQPGRMDAKGAGLFRGRFGTTAAAHAQGTPVILFPFRYWDRWQPRADAPELAYFTLSVDQPSAWWESFFFDKEDTDSARLGVLARSDPETPWDADPEDDARLRLFWRGDADGKTIPIGRQSTASTGGLRALRPGRFDLKTARARMEADPRFTSTADGPREHRAMKRRTMSSRRGLTLVELLLARTRVPGGRGVPDPRPVALLWRRTETRRGLLAQAVSTRPTRRISAASRADRAATSSPSESSSTRTATASATRSGRGSVSCGRRRRGRAAAEGVASRGRHRRGRGVPRRGSSRSCGSWCPRRSPRRARRGRARRASARDGCLEVVLRADFWAARTARPRAPRRRSAEVACGSGCSSRRRRRTSTTGGRRARTRLRGDVVGRGRAVPRRTCTPGTSPVRMPRRDRPLPRGVRFELDSSARQFYAPHRAHHAGRGRRPRSGSTT